MGPSGGAVAEPEVVVSLAAVIVAITDDEPRVLTVSVPVDVPLELVE